MRLQSLTVVELNLRLPPELGQPPPEVRFWVDLEPAGPLRTESEVALALERPWVYRGTFTVEPTGQAHVFYRLGLCAAPGSSWSLRIRDGAEGPWLLTDGDTLDRGKCWLVGSCPLGTARRPAELFRLEDYRPRRSRSTGRTRSPA